MKGYGLFFYLAEAYRGLRANSLVNFLAMGTISMAMLIVGFSLLVFLNLRTTVNAMGERLEISVYLKDGLTPQEKDYVGILLKSEPGVKKTVFVSKGEALGQLRKELKGQEPLLEGLSENPLPDSYELTIDSRYSDVAHMAAMASKIAKYSGVDDVSYGQQSVEVLDRLLRMVAYGGTALAVLLGVTVVFIISNSVRLALYSRGGEIELMQWIGATRSFITGPFLVEGMLVSITGAALSIGVLAAVFRVLPQEAVLFLAGPDGVQFLSPAVIACMIGGGALLGLIGGFISVNRFLE
jgi:cell division transport system permease protein